MPFLNDKEHTYAQSADPSSANAFRQSLLADAITLPAEAANADARLILPLRRASDHEGSLKAGQACETTLRSACFSL